MTDQLKGITKLSSNTLQLIQFSLRHGYQEAKRMEHKNTMKNGELLFKQINKELRTRLKKDKLEKCEGDACHSKCSDNCMCGWCLLRKGYEPLI